MLVRLKAVTSVWNATSFGGYWEISVIGYNLISNITFDLGGAYLDVRDLLYRHLVLSKVLREDDVPRDEGEHIYWDTGLRDIVVYRTSDDKPLVIIEMLIT